MEAAFAITLGVLCACGIYLLLCARVLPVILGITLFSYAINLFLLGFGTLRYERWAGSLASTRAPPATRSSTVLKRERAS